MKTIDWIALGLVALFALAGFRRGLVATALSLAGIVGGAIVGARVAPGLLPDGASRFGPWAVVAGAVIGAALLNAAASLLGSLLRSGLRVTPLGLVDSAVGLVLGAAAGLALVWLLGAAALHVPGKDDWRRTVRRSEILQRLNELVPPSTLDDALARFDPFPRLVGPLAPRAPLAPTTGAVLRLPGVRAAGPSVVRVVGDACGFGITGSGWVASRDLVVTAAHVVAGERRTWVELRGGRRLAARTAAFDARNDVAVLRVPGLATRPLRLGDARPGVAVAVLGYPENGPFAAAAGRLGPTERVVSEDVYGRRPVEREMTSVRARVRHGNSGGPVVDAAGVVRGTVFGAAARDGRQTALAVPSALVRRALAVARGAVATGRCLTG